MFFIFLAILNEIVWRIFQQIMGNIQIIWYNAFNNCLDVGSNASCFKRNDKKIIITYLRMVSTLTYKCF